MNTCALQLDDYLISHAARMAITLRYHKNMDLEPKHLRVFWVIYALEKQQTMHGRACSVGYSHKQPPLALDVRSF
jgi:hypothetical protein